MKIGIIGAGNIGAALAGHFHRLHHTVQIANSRGPETLTEVAEKTGATPVAVSKVAQGADLLVVAVPMNKVSSLPKDLLRELPQTSPIIDTGNYVPAMTGVIDEIEEGLTDSEWTSRVLGRSVVKVFNNLTTYSLIHGGLPNGSNDRIALPVAGDDAKSKELVIALLDDMGFDGVDAGPLSESWRQQIGTPAGGTDYGADRLRTELARADRNAVPKMRDVILQKMFSLPPETTPQQAVQVARDAWTEPYKN